ncbi:thioredoxin-like domain-containing protein [Mucilaginibacter flavus]|uniref:thioredoxin-like domain-containing protein n=1 Tax=Mucilaginibacter flavus TaxID=931504 RepID=UPI0025B4010F|nr:thioredoxin-like domain-containing protein [Mucilaginibacter flavus]MDN3584264.1 thioredoxin-like domain-containing protein [Mucilaginibacter flavus]
MKKILFISVIILNITLTAYSQSKSCYNDWGFWQNLNTPGANTNFRISFKQPISKKEDCQYIWYRFENLFAIPDAYLMFKVDYKKPNGVTGTETFSYVKLDKTGVFTDSGNFMVGYEVIRVYNVMYKELPGKKKANENPLPQSSQDRTNKLLNEPSKANNTLRPRAAVIGDRAENTRPNVEAVALTNSNQTMQQVQYQNKANAYINDAQYNTNDINKALDLNLAAINAQASGNRAELQQVQQLQQQQSQQQMQQLGDQVTNVISGIMDRKFRKDQENNADMTARINEWSAERKAAELRKRDMVKNFGVVINSTRKITELSRYPMRLLPGLMLLNSLHARLDSVQGDQGSVDADGTLTFRNKPMGKMHGIPDDVLSMPYYSDVYERKTIYLDKVNKDKYAEKVGDFYKSYFNALAYLKGDAKNNIAVDVLRALNLLKHAENLYLNKDQIVTERKYLHHKVYYEIYFGDLGGSTIQLGFIGLAQMDASVTIGNIYADSAAVTHNSAYTKKAFEQYDRAINYYLSNLHAYAADEKNSKQYDIENYRAAFQHAYYNMLLTTIKIVDATYNNASADEKKFAEQCTARCLDLYVKYYDVTTIAENLQKQGSSYLDQNLYNTAMLLLKKAADQGDDIAMVQIGSMYEKGLGVPKDFDKAFEWYKKALAKGNTAGNSFIRVLTNVLSFKNTKANNFTQTNTQNIPFSLSQFKGKYILLNFWASWNRWDRAENKNLASVYEKYKNQNFTIVSVSLDYNRENWLAAVAEDKLTWTNLSDLKRYQNAVALLYKVESIPANFLIAPSGKIIEVNLIGDDLTAALGRIIK